MQFIHHAHLKLCLLFMPIAFCISGCDDGPMQTCCSYFENSDAFKSAIADQNQGPWDLIYIYLTAVREFAKQKDHSDVGLLFAGEYLCSIMPEMKGINYDFHANDDMDANKVCSASIPKHDVMANKIKEAWDNCCFVLGNHVLQRKDDSCRKIDADAYPEASSTCWKELEDKEFEYLSCFRTYVTTGECEYIID